MLFMLVATVAIGWLYAWTPPGFQVRSLTAHATDYYHEYADALLAGQLHLTRAPDPRLLALTDPLDPVANEPFRLNDLSLHRGRYYLYHGIVPAVVLLAPVRWLTGEHLSLTAAVWLFCVLGSATAVGLLLAFRREFAPSAGAAATAAAALVLVFAPGVHVVLHGGSMNQLPIASAYLFALLGLAALWRARPGQTRAALWLGLASLAFGLAVGSRPNFVFASAALLPLAVLWQWRSEGFPRRRLVARFAWAGGPAIGCIGALLALNWARFGDPLEFGMRFMLGAWDQRELPALNWVNLFANARHYLWGTSDVHATFPYVTAPSWTAAGILNHAPFAWFALLPLLAGALRRRLGGGPIVAGAASFGLINCLVLAFLPSGDTATAPTSANARYVLDFHPALMLAAAMGVVALAHEIAGRRAARWALIIAAWLLAGVSSLTALSLHLGRYPLESIRAVARNLSWPAWWLERARGERSGPLAFDIKFPADRTGAREPLLAIGDSRAGDLVVVFYESPSTARFELVGVGREGPSTAAIAIDYGRVHRLELHLGPLQPPPHHPDLRNLPDEAAARLSRSARILMDGQPVLDVPTQFSSTAGAPWQVGRTEFLLDRSSAQFAGEIARLERLPVAIGEMPARAEFGALRLRVRFPAERTAGADPLLTTGIAQAGDVLFIRYGATGQIQVGYDHWGHRGVASPWLLLDRTAEHEIEISSGSLYPPEDHPMMAHRPVDERRMLKERLQVRLNGTVVLDVPQPAYESSPHDVVLGRNSIGASSCGYLFSGEILEASRRPFPAHR